MGKNNGKEDNFSDFNKENNIEIFKENKKVERKSKKYRTRRNERKSLIKEGINPDSLSSRDNLLKFNSNVNIPFVNEKEYENKPGNNFFKKEIEEKIENNNYINNNNFIEHNMKKIIIFLIINILRKKIFLRIKIILRIIIILEEVEKENLPKDLQN